MVLYSLKKKTLNPNVVGPLLLKSFKKYGFKSHIFEIIEECSIEDLNILEIYYKLNVLLVDGKHKTLFCELYDTGGGPKSEETKLKQSKALKGREGAWKNKKRPEHSAILKSNSGFKYERTETHKNNLSQIMKKNWEEKREDLIKNIKKNKIGKKVKAIKCNETGIIFNSIKECSKNTGISEGIICTFVKGKYKYPSIKGFTFSYAKDLAPQE